MKIRFAHTNIIAKDWKKLSDFYIQVFNCHAVPPIRDQQGEWLSRGTGVPQAHLQGIHLRLPGHGSIGPTLEIYQYVHMLEKPHSSANRQGLGHLAFEVDEIEDVLENAINRGGNLLGELSETIVEGVGRIRFIYITDPEGNIIELQSWDLNPSKID